ncbi:MAG: hypothetical protein WAU28_00200 [Candidatus Moraniibacteriota bacterium]
MEQKTTEALKWIVKILNDNRIHYRIGGGLAVALYGSTRPIKDIDISLSGKYFPVIVPIVQQFIIAGPQHYLNEKWDCATLSLNYHEQDIDLTDVDTLLMKNHEETEWIKNEIVYDKYPTITKKIEGMSVTLMHPKVLLEYKQHLSGEHQESDQKFLEQYIRKSLIKAPISSLAN